MAGQQVQKFKDDLNKKLHERNQFTGYLATIESKTGIDRLYIVAGVGGILSLYLIFGYFAQLVCNVIGFLYPAYVSIKAIESADKRDDTQWLTYWVVFGLFNCIEFASDAIIGWFPIYWLCKCALMLYLHLPMTMGAQIIYNRFIRPFVIKHQKGIDEKLASAAGKLADKASEGLDQMKEH